MKPTPIIKDKESLEAFRKSVYDSQSPEQLQQRISFHATWWYIYGVTPEGKQMILGPKNTEAEVVRIGDEQDLTGPQGEAPYTYELNTIDLHRATRIIKEDLIERGISADTVLRRAKHK